MPIFLYKYISILEFMTSQGNVKGHVFQNQAWSHLIFMFYFYFLALDDSVYKKLEKFQKTSLTLIPP